MDIVDNIKIVNLYNSKIINEFIKYYKFIYTNQNLLNKTSREIFYKLNNIKKVIQILSSYKNNITLVELPNILKIKYIGEKTIERIKEILKTGKLNEITHYKKKEKIINELTKIHSIGIKRALQLYEEYNVKSINDFKKKVKNKTIKLTYQQNIGLNFYDSLCTKIPNILILDFNKYLQKLINNYDNQFTVTLCGSFRREKPFSQDIDILITHEKIKTLIQCKKYLTVILKLFESFIVGNLILNYNTHFQGYASFGNILKNNKNTTFKLNSVFRIDIIVVPFQCYYTGLLHFTGSGSFNQKIRNIAKSKNMKLNEYFLTDEKNKKLTITSEKDIFEYLELDYVFPKDRN